MPSTKRKLRVTFLDSQGIYMGHDIIDAPEPYSTPAAFRACVRWNQTWHPSGAGGAFTWEIA